MAAAGQEAADAPERVPQRQRRGEQVRRPERGYAAAPRGEEERGRAEHQAAVEDEAVLEALEEKDQAGGEVGAEFLPVGDGVKELGAQHAADDGVEDQVGELLLVEAGGAGLAEDVEDGREVAAGHQQAVGRQFERTQLEDDGVHQGCLFM